MNRNTGFQQNANVSKNRDLIKEELQSTSKLCAHRQTVNSCERLSHLLIDLPVLFFLVLLMALHPVPNNVTRDAVRIVRSVLRRKPEALPGYTTQEIYSLARKKFPDAHSLPPVALRKKAYRLNVPLCSLYDNLPPQHAIISMR